MPTGYTNDIKDGISFETFALNCARAFGACIDLRDDPAGGDHIPEKIKPSSFHLDEMYKCEQELIELSFMNDSEIAERLELEYENDEIYRINRIKEKENQRITYENMLNKVFDWNPPTVDHQKLKKFMIDQIEDSIKFDCSNFDNYYDTPTERQTVNVWRNNRIDILKNSIKYNKKLYIEEVKRAKSKTDWLMALRNSLKDNN